MQDGTHVILCVDDDADVLQSLKTILESNGYAFVGAATAEEGLAKYRENQPDLLLVDLMMEEVDAGTNLVKTLKAEGNTRLVYMLSSVGDELNREADYSAMGLAGVFQKPIEPATLLDTLKKKLP